MTSMEQARMMYRNMPGFDQPSLVEAGSGWVLVNSSSGTISLNAPASGKVSHYLRVWWHPDWKFLLVQNNYRSRAPFTVSKRIHSNVQFTRHFNGTVGQSVYLLDLETERGLANYTVYYELPPMLVMNNYPEPGGISVYRDPDDFFAETDIKPLLFREFGVTSRGLEFSSALRLAHQDVWFSFSGVAGLWQPFLAAAELNGADRGKWAQWNARDFFVQELQIQFPGVSVADGSIELTGTGSGDIREQLELSTDSGPFSKAIAPLSPEVEDRLSGYRNETRTESRHESSLMSGRTRLYSRVHELLWLKRTQ